MTDSERIEWLARLAKESSTGISIEHVRGEGFRFMSRHRLDRFHSDIRKSIDEGIALRQPLLPPETQS
jgi:hypothetical protein